MAPDRRRLERMYGSVPPQPNPGWGLAIWAGLLLIGAAGSAVLSIVAFVGANTDDAATAQLRDWGVLDTQQEWVALHLDDATAESGCAITLTELIRWQDRQVTTRLPLAGATIDRQDRGLRVMNGSDTAFCPSDPGSDLRVFEAMAERRTRVRQGDWHPGPDPRVAKYFR